MFLLPALGSGTCDILVLYIHSTISDMEEEHDDGSSSSEENGNGRYGWIHIKSTHYLATTSSLRLLLLILPLTYHNLTGHRLKCPILYHIFHTLSLLFILSHMLAIIMLDPKSINTLLPFPFFFSTIKTRRVLSIVIMRRIWCLLTLSVISICSHWTMLWHLRCTAPEDLEMSRHDKRKKQMMAYVAIHRYGYLRMKREEEEEEEEEERSVDVGSTKGTMESTSEEELENGEEEEEESSLDLLLPCEEGRRLEETAPPEEQTKKTTSTNLEFQKKKSKNQLSCISEGYDDFLGELQNRMKIARKQWSEKLEEFTWIQRTRGNRNNADTRQSTTTSTNLLHYYPLSSKSPFKVILQLFAYDDVLSNGKLDSCFEIDNGEALTFYVPQLLSFLLHGAFLNSTELEFWILEKCKINLHFAHVCFWFLRGWCLCSGQHDDSNESYCEEGGQQQQYLESGLLDRRTGIARKFHGSETSLSQYENSSSMSNCFPYTEEMNSGLRRHRSNSCGGSVDLRRGSKFPAEERRMIEALLFRVVDSGELAAKKLQFGSDSRDEEDVMQPAGYCRLETNEDDDSSNQSMTCIPPDTASDQFIPIDPANGLPSIAHLDCITATHKHGFLPLSDQETPPNTTLFFSAPRFLDALCNIASSLFLTPREKRTKELRHKLRSLEVAMLPSNVVYMPMNNVHHRVWRIISAESIAISTKERVPCIVTLEVVDYRQNKTKDAMILEQWVKKERFSQRHERILDKVQHYAHKGLQKLREHEGEIREMIGMEKPHQNLLEQPVEQEEDCVSFRETNQTDEEGQHHETNGEDKLMSPLFQEQNGQMCGLNGLHHEQIQQPNTTSSDINFITQNTSSSTHESTHPTITPPTSPSSSPSVNMNMGQWSCSSIHHVNITPDHKTSLKKRLFDRNQTNFDASSKEDKPSTNSEESPSTTQSNFSKRKTSFSEEDYDISEPDLPDDALFYGATHDAISSHSNSPSSSSKPIQINTQTDQPPQPQRPPLVVFKEDWSTKSNRLRSQSAIGSHPNWRLLPILIKSNDDLRQEQLASQLIRQMATILSKSKVPVWLYPYEILALSDTTGIIEAIPDTISLDSLKRNDPNYTSLQSFFQQHFGPVPSDTYANARANFVESLAAYSIVCFLLQIKDRHNGNILLDNKGHLIHIDFGFFLLSSPGQNSGFESAPFKLTREFVHLMDGPTSRTFSKFRELCIRTFLVLRKHFPEITLLLEMIMEGSDDIPCFRNNPEEAIKNFKSRFRLELSDRACVEYVNGLVDESLENWRTRWYDRYQRFCVGVL